MANQRVRVVDDVPRARLQRTPAATPAPVEPEPEDAGPGARTYGRILPDEGIGRLPMIGLDTGAIKGSVPGANLH